MPQGDVPLLFRNFAGVMEHNVKSIRNKIYEIRGQRVIRQRGEQIVHPWLKQKIVSLVCLFGIYA